MSVGFIIGMILLAAFGGYVLTSLLLLRFPTLLHKKKVHKFKCRHISHRGGAGENLENTMAAFKHAAAVGTDMLEIDCHITADGQVVVSHDSKLTRTTVSACEATHIADTMFEDLPLLKPTLKIDFAQNHMCQGGEDRKIALLKDVFEAFPMLPINIDIKIDSDQLMRKVSDMITEYNREDITVWGNKSSVICDKLYKLNPEVLQLYSIKRVLCLLLMFYSGVLPFVPLKEGFYEVIMPSIILKPGKLSSEISRKWKALVHIADFLLMSKVMIGHLRRRGIQTYLWVLNEEDEFEKAFNLGATGVMTDYPTKLRHYLDSHPEYDHKNIDS